MNEELSIEHGLILKIIKSNLSDLESEEVKQLIEGPVDWKEILGQLYSHRIAGLFYANMKKITPRKLFKESHISLSATVNANNKYNTEYFSALREITDKLLGCEIEYVILKGPILIGSIYGKAVRTSNDIDILIHPSSISALKKALGELGYIQGDYDRKTGTIIPPTRKQELLWRSTTHEIWPFFKKASGEFLDVIKLDINVSIDIGNHGTDQDLVAKILKKRILLQFEDCSVFSLSWEDFLMHLCIHAAKEVNSVWAIRGMIDLSLYKFCDIHYTIMNVSIDWNKFVEVIIEENQLKEVFHALYFTELLFENTIDPQILGKMQAVVCDLEYLDEYPIGENQRAKWKTPFPRRAFDFERFKGLRFSQKSLDFANQLKDR